MKLTPIECSLLAALKRAGLGLFKPGDFRLESDQGRLLLMSGEENVSLDKYPDGVVFHLPFLRYRLDALVIGSLGIALGVECDGHDFHDRTQQQASYDRARDREMLRAGLPVIRFTGSDIHHDADKCASDVVDILRSVEKALGRKLAASSRSGFATGMKAGAEKSGVVVISREIGSDEFY